MRDVRRKNNHPFNIMSWLENIPDDARKDARNRAREHNTMREQERLQVAHEYNRLFPMVTRLLADVGDACFGKTLGLFSRYTMSWDCPRDANTLPRNYSNKPWQDGSRPHWEVVGKKSDFSIHVYSFPNENGFYFVVYESHGFHGDSKETTGTGEAELKSVLREAAKSLSANLEWNKNNKNDQNHPYNLLLGLSLILTVVGLVIGIVCGNWILLVVAGIGNYIFGEEVCRRNR